MKECDAFSLGLGVYETVRGVCGGSRRKVDEIETSAGVTRSFENDGVAGKRVQIELVVRILGPVAVVCELARGQQEASGKITEDAHELCSVIGNSGYV
jgi:hypothetical protein